MVPMLAFDPEVYASRLTLVQAHLDTQGLGGVLLFDPENMYWLTGYQTIGYFTFQTMFVPASGKPVVVSRVVNRDLALAHDTIDEFIDIVDTASPVDVLAVYLNDTVPDTRPIGIETRAFYLTVKDHRALDTATAHELQDWGGVIEPARMCKLDAEIECMRHAARAAEAGLRAAIDTVAPGKTENDVAAAMFNATISTGSEYLGHPPLVVAGERTALCFAMWRRQAIARDDVVVLEAAGCVERYHAMLSRPVVAGTPSTRQQDAADALQGVLEAAIDAIKPGLSAAEVDDRCRQVVEKRGLGKFFKHRSAYGIGIGFPPNWSEGHIYAIRPDDPLVLQPNMTFHVIPTVFLEDFGMCFSDSVRVTQTGCELLTTFPRRLYSID
ncbi:MAG: hypothetical protein CMO26_01900 [Thiotrichales bacterium]|nr:hypothetical protein [Thiotrichales bacterium]